MAKTSFTETCKFHLLCLRDTIFFVIITMFPIALILFKDHYLTWYVLSGYIYSLVSSSIFELLSNKRKTGAGVMVHMVKIIFLLSTFIMILLNKNTNRVIIDARSIVFFALLSACLYYETYRAKTAAAKN